MIMHISFFTSLVLLVLISVAHTFTTTSNQLREICVGQYNSHRRSTQLYSATPNRRPIPRRKLKKRPGRDSSSRTQKTQSFNNNFENNKFNQIDTFSSSDPGNTPPIIEIKPLIKTRSVEQGLDYWIDEADLKKQKMINDQFSGQIDQQKLREETVAPYKQNWIGLVSVSMIALSVIVQEFPELLQSPVIPIPDL